MIYPMKGWITLGEAVHKKFARNWQLSETDLDIVLQTIATIALTEDFFISLKEIHDRNMKLGRVE